MVGPVAQAAAEDPQTKSSSVQQFLTVLIVNLGLFALFISIFIFLRKRQRRVYEPRYVVKSVPNDLKPGEAPRGPFAWLIHVLKKPQSYIIQQTNSDGYFFIRFLFGFACICILGCFLLWPILFPINAINSNNMTGLDTLSYANVKDKYKTFVHVFLSWIFFGGVLFFIYREIAYYIKFRHVLQTTPLYDSLLSSRILLLTEISDNLYNEDILRNIFPAASHIWYGRDYSKLKGLVEKRAKFAGKYEDALNGELKNAVKKRDKKLKKGKQPPTPADDLNKYLKDGEKRPTHRRKFVGCEKVDTLDYCAKRLGELNNDIQKSQHQHTDNPPISSVFIEFPSQLELQRAYQAIPYNRNLKSAKTYTGITPEDLIWDNLNSSPITRKLKKIFASTVLTLMILFWSIPVTFIGVVTNINMLTEKVKFLSFINDIPDVLLGFITGLLPVAGLALLMAMVPVFIKLMGKISGCLTVQEVEAFCHSWYYAFLVIQSFLVLTLASAATSAISSVIDEPQSALTILGEKVPPVSNFYIANTCYQSLALSSGLLLQIGSLILPKILGIFDSTPRAKWTRYHTLNKPDWSVIYPPYQLIALIALIYAIIAPLILGFSTLAFILLYMAYLYFLIYIQEPNTTDMRGRFYPRALLQLFVGIYLGELCLVALFVFKQNWAAIVLEVIWIVVTAAVHIYINWKFLPLFDIVPISAIKYAAGDATCNYPYHDHGSSEKEFVGKNYWEGENRFEISQYDQALINLPGEAAPQSADPEANTSQKLSPLNYLIRFFNPKKETFEAIRKIMPQAYFKYVEYNPRFLSAAYYDPAVSDEKPVIWIAKDPMGISEKEMNKTRQYGVDISNDNATISDKGDVIVTGSPPNYQLPPKM